MVDFPQALLHHSAGPLWIVWDRLAARRSRITGYFIASQNGRLKWMPARLCAGTEPGRVPLGFLETAPCPNVCSKDYCTLRRRAGL